MAHPAPAAPMIWGPCSRSRAMARALRYCTRSPAARGWRRPAAGLTLAGALLYGTTTAGGGAGLGTVFAMSTDGGDFQVLHAFAGGNVDGATPTAALTLLGGELYGTTVAGGETGQGTVFVLDAGGANYQVMHDFLGATSDGASPYAGLVAVGGALLRHNLGRWRARGRGRFFRWPKSCRRRRR